MYNPIHISGSILYIECRNTYPYPTYVTASLESRSTIEQYRWRVVNNECVTTTFEGGKGYEVKITLPQLLTKKNRFTKVNHKNGNQLDCTLQNIGLNNRCASTRVNGDSALLLIDGTEVVVDLPILPFVEQFSWRFDRTHRYIYHYEWNPKTKKAQKVYMERYITNIVGENGKKVVFKNSNRFDMRRQNLVVKDKAGRTNK